MVRWGPHTFLSPLELRYKGSTPFLCPLLKPRLASDAMFLSFSSSPSTTTTVAAAAPSTNSYGDSGLHNQLFCSAATPHGHYHEDGVSGGFAPFPCSFPSEHYLRRSSSTHSLALNQYAPESINQPPHPPPTHPSLQYSSSPSSSSCDYLDFNAGPVRRVLSTGDLQGTNALLESYGQDGGGAPGRVARYSAEERKERIERYRSKRNQRNFHKKITYACRKTLADSRPRVRGRFARNGETETEAEAEASETATTNSFSCYNASGGNGGDWWSQLHVALATDDEDDRYYDGDVLVSFADDDDFSRNILF